MLAHQWYSDSGIPVVFLHGLLGSQQDWVAVLERLQIFSEIRPLTLDLPCHCQSEQISCRDFAELRALLHSTLTQRLGEQSFYLVGYSLGGRVALDYAMNTENPYLLGVVLESTNVGLATEQERADRWQNDLHWSARFRTEPIKEVLQAWYQQPVFADLSESKRAKLVEKRQKNNGERIAEMLQATSLAKQAFYGDRPFTNITFLIGEKDRKFRQLAEQYCLPHRLIVQAGHNAHWENPHAFVQQLCPLILGEK